MIRCYRSKPQFRVQRRQSNNANTWFNQIQKLLKLNISFIASNDFRRLRPVFYYYYFFLWCQHLNTSIFVFLFLSKVSVPSVHFQESMRWLFPIQIFISLVIHFPFKWPRQEAKTKRQQNKTTFTATRSEECSPTNRRQPTKFFWARCRRDFALTGYFALPIVFSGIWLAQTSCLIFLKLDSLPICKGKSYLKLSKLILNWTVRKN